MRLIALEIPDDQARLPGWLEERLLGLDLAALVAELEAAHPPARGAGTPLGDILGQNRGAVLEKGLSALPPARLRQLLRQPRLLLDLQELILVEGGENWRKTTREDRESRQLVERGWNRLDAFLRSGSADVGTSGTAGSTIPWYRRSWVVAWPPQPPCSRAFSSMSGRVHPRVGAGAGPGPFARTSQRAPI
jgi:hypothetical protein